MAPRTPAGALLPLASPCANPPAPQTDGTPVDRVVDALTRGGWRPVRQGTGWEAHCPAHNDRTPSLSVGEGSDGQALVHCHAGCDVEKVVAELGLAMGDLFPEPDQRDERPRIVATYPYHDEAGTLLFEVVRYSPKAFRPGSVSKRLGAAATGPGTDREGSRATRRARSGGEDAPSQGWVFLSFELPAGGRMALTRCRSLLV